MNSPKADMVRGAAASAAAAALREICARLGGPENNVSSGRYAPDTVPQQACPKTDFKTVFKTDSACQFLKAGAA
jgi:hypothetical protein